METHSAASSPNGSIAAPVLHPWDVGPAVARMQELLQAHGFALRIDGDFGWRTEAALKLFQRRHGLRIDGIVGQETWATLMATIKPGTRLLRQGCAGADVFELQGLLQVNGYAIRRSGAFDTETRSAVLAFQKEHQLRETGAVDGVIWALLQNRNSGRNPGRQPSKSRFAKFSRKKR